jgi:hypothetical protein
MRLACRTPGVAVDGEERCGKMQNIYLGETILYKKENNVEISNIE